MAENGIITMMDTALFPTKTAKPFLKWAGGKGQLIEAIDQRLPADLKYGKITRYVEPFLGGGAVFFHIAQKFEHLQEFYLNDANEDLCRCYRAIQNDVEAVVYFLKQFEKKYLAVAHEQRKAFYLQARQEFNREKFEQFTEKTAALLLFLNRTCFNGLYRVNRKGQFNVPFGKYAEPTICNEENLKAAAALLQKANLMCGDFEQCLDVIDCRSFVYLDPPYRPISKTASFTAYAKEDFSEADQIRLAEFCRAIDAKGAKFLLSNSDPKNQDPNDHFFEQRYAGFHIERVKASRAINCNGAKRGQINEIIITN